MTNKMYPLPFYEVLEVLIKPTPLVNHGQYSAQKDLSQLSLSSLQQDRILKSRKVVHSTTEDGTPTITTQYSTQVQLRFWTSTGLLGRHLDLLPAELTIQVNNDKVHPPPPFTLGLPHNRPASQTFDITSSVVHFASNFIHIKWYAEPEYDFYFSVNLVKKLTVQELLSKLINKPVKPSHSTQQLIKELTSRSSEDQDLCCPTSLRVSLTCPLGKSRMSYPCRGVNCKHLQCFDANSFLMMNEKKSSFLCPVCSQQLKISELCLDEYFMNVIKNLSNEQGGGGNDVELFPDGSWSRIRGGTPNNQSKKKSSPSDLIIETVTLDDEDEENEIFIINEVDDPCPPALESSFRLFANGIQQCSSRRRSTLFDDINLGCNSSTAAESSFGLFACGVQRSSSRRNSLCGDTTQVIHFPETLNEPEVIDILD